MRAVDIGMRRERQERRERRVRAFRNPRSAECELGVGRCGSALGEYSATAPATP